MYKVLGSQQQEPAKYQFAASKLSGNILKELLSETLTSADEMKLFSGSIPKQYTENQDTLFEYNSLLRLSTMAVRDWKERLATNGLDTVYMDEDIVKDAKYFYDAWSRVHDETGNHIVQKYFFKMMYEISAELNRRGYEVVDSNGKTTSHDEDHIKILPAVPVTAGTIMEKMQKYQMGLPSPPCIQRQPQPPSSPPSLSIQMEPLEPHPAPERTLQDSVISQDAQDFMDDFGGHLHGENSIGVSFDNDTERDDAVESESTDNPFGLYD